MQVERSALAEAFGLTPMLLSGGWVSNAWATCLEDRDNSLKRLLIPDVVRLAHVDLIKGETRFEMGPRPIS